MSQSAVVPNPNKWVFNRRLNWPRLSDWLSPFGWQGVPHSWVSDSETSVTVGGTGTSDGAKSRVSQIVLNTGCNSYDSVF